MENYALGNIHPMLLDQHEIFPYIDGGRTTPSLEMSFPEHAASPYPVSYAYNMNASMLLGTFS